MADILAWVDPVAVGDDLGKHTFKSDNSRTLHFTIKAKSSDAPGTATVRIDNFKTGDTVTSSAPIVMSQDGTTAWAEVIFGPDTNPIGRDTKPIPIVLHLGTGPDQPLQATATLSSGELTYEYSTV